MEAFVYEKYGPPAVLQKKEIPRPTLSDGEILVKVFAVALNAADWRLMRGIPFVIRFDNGLLKPRKSILGSDIAGRVEAVGNGVTQFKPGDVVYGDIGLGGFAEYVITKEDKLSRKPTNLTFEQAAAVPKATTTALQALQDVACLQVGQNVLVNGASGGVGMFAVQIAVAFGATVTGVVSTGSLDFVQALGAERVIDYTKQQFTEDNETYDVILDVAGNRSAQDYLRALKPDGKAVIIGFTTLSHMFKTLLQSKLVLRGSKQTISAMNAQPNQHDLNTLNDMINDSRVKPIIDRCFDFEEIPRAMNYLETGHPRGKVVVRIVQED
jgi:NADPH:quinone reductase-like Zn-dependent oxidoreductase